jgi:RHS repeat-associated protein
VTTAGACSSYPCSTFTYDNDNRRLQSNFNNGGSAGPTLTFGYDNAGNQTSAIGKSSTGSVLSSFTYSFASGSTDRSLLQSVTENDSLASNVTTTYTYNALNELITAAPTSGTTLNYSYDPTGNRCSLTTSCSSRTYQYNAANELCWSLASASSANSCSSTPSGATTYSYDADGNETATSSHNSLTYNAQNQITAMTYGGQTLSPLSYADVGQAQRTVAGSTTFVNSPLGLMSMKASNVTTYFVRDNQGRLIGEWASNHNTTHYYFLTDAVGSVVDVVGSNSALADQFRYDPFGQSTHAQASLADPMRYAGGYLDATNLYHFGNRYYDPSLGRWTQQDSVPGSIASPSQLDRYIYASNDPVKFVDRTGDDAWSCTGDIFGIILGGAFSIGSAVFGVVTSESVVGAVLGWAGIVIGVGGIVFGIHGIATGDC